MTQEKRAAALRAIFQVRAFDSWSENFIKAHELHELRTLRDIVNDSEMRLRLVDRLDGAIAHAEFAEAMLDAGAKRKRHSKPARLKMAR